MSRPPKRTLVPSWSLPAVLRALVKPPFEPMAQASFHHLTVKTVFLVAIASGQRRSTLHALTLEPGHVRWESAGVRLIPRAGFLAKNQTVSSKEAVQIFLPSLSSHSSVMQDKLWGPVRALKWYVDRSSSLRTSPICSYLHSRLILVCLLVQSRDGLLRLSVLRVQMPSFLLLRVRTILVVSVPRGLYLMELR